MKAQRRASGDLKMARDLLTRAHAAATLHGYATVARRAASALADLNWKKERSSASWLPRPPRRCRQRTTWVRTTPSAMILGTAKS